MLWRFLAIWAPLMLLLAAGMLTLHSVEVDGKKAVLSANEKNAVLEATAVLNYCLSVAHGDVRYMANQPLLRHFLETGRGSERTRLTASYRAFMASRDQLYDQLRYIDENGDEAVRVNWNGGDPQAVPDDQLQHKIDRYYVRDTLALPPGAVYMSPFDLNVEHGQVETPRKPMIRFAAKVVDRQGRPRGLVVLNYLGQQLLDRVRQVSREGISPLWLVNERGDWLIGPQADDEWGFMYPDKAQSTLASQQPELWRALNAGPQSGQVMVGDALLTYATFMPGRELSSRAGEIHTDPKMRWFVVAHLPRAALVAQSDPMASVYLTAYVLLGIMFAAAVWRITLLGTRRQQAEQATQASETRFRALLESAPDAIVVSDTQGHIALVNNQTERLFGFTRDELLGQSVETLIPERFRQRHVGHRAGYVADPSSRPMGPDLDLHGRHKDGTEFAVGISLNSVDTDRGRLIFSAIRDVSERRAADRKILALNQELAQQNSAMASLNSELQAFSYSVSHDLRAPLRSIDGFSQVLLEDHAGRLDEEGQDFLRRVRAAAQRMGLLIDDMIMLSRVTRAEMNVQDFDMSALAREVIDSLRQAEPGRPVAVSIAPGLSARGDARLIRIALENLLGNAWKYSSRTNDARIEFGREESDGRPAFCVRDNGAGFDMTYADKLFRPFQRLHTASEFPGSGIGLAIVQRVIHKHGGRVWAQGEEGKGAAFYFTLPT